MNTREHFDTLLLSCRDRIQKEVSSLIGKPFTLAEPEFCHASKEALFSGAGGREVLIHADLSGEVQGEGCILIGINDAIRLGGALIMLPEPELDKFLSGQDYTEELRDSCGEIAHVICDAATTALKERYPENVRLVSGRQEIVVPAEVTIASEQPIPDMLYYLMTASMRIDERELGPLRLVLPAAPFGLEDSGGTDAAPDSAAVRQPADEQVPPASSSNEQDAHRQDVARQKKLVDDLLTSGMTKMREELQILFTGTLTVVPKEYEAVTKGEFLDQVNGRQVMTRLDIKGGSQGEAYLFVEDKTAIYLGGTLIMLPEVELEELILTGDFNDEIHEAYGEVTDIVAGVYSALFEEHYHNAFGLTKRSMELIVPAKINPDSNTLFPAQTYYLATGQIHYNDRNLGLFQLLIPAGALALEDVLLLDGEMGSAGEAPRALPIAAPAGKPVAAEESGPLWEEQAEERADILLFTDDDNEAGRIAGMLAAMGYVCRILHFKETVHSVMHPGIRMVFLVMREASEVGFSVAIKISSAGLQVPLVAAGPAWTSALVLKAVKYGACDILVTPASSEDVQEKIEVNMMQKAV